MDRTALRQMCRDFLGVKTTDAFYTDARIDSMLNISERQLSEEIRRQAPDLERAIVTLVADSSSSNSYTFATQAPPVTDFLEVLELRLTDTKGYKLRRVSDADIEGVRGGAYSLIGADASPVITTGNDVAAGSALYLKYGKRTPTWDAPNASPATVPIDYHDVIAFSATELLVGLGGEAQMPPTLAKWGMDRRGQLWHHIGSRSPDPQRVPNEYGHGFVETVRH